MGTHKIDTLRQLHTALPRADVMIFKYFRRKNRRKKLAFVDTKQSWIMKNFDHNIGFWEKRQFFSPKIVKNRRKLWP
jgi:hypothetical protein